MVFGQCEVEQRARRLIFNSAQQHSAGLTLGQRLFPQCIYSERPVPPVSSELFSQGGLDPGWEAGGGHGVWMRKGDGRGEQADLGQSPPRSPESSQGLLGGRGASTPEGGPPGLLLLGGHSATPRPQRRGVAGSTGQGCSRRGGKALRPGRGFPVPPALSAADTPSGNENLGVAVSFSFAQGRRNL